MPYKGKGKMVLKLEVSRKSSHSAGRYYLICIQERYSALTPVFTIAGEMEYARKAALT